MSNSLSVIDMVARESLRIAHEKLTYLGTINRNYDDSYGKTGAKIGDSLRVRNPNQYVRRQGSRVMNVQDQAETTQTITASTQDGVDMKFNSAELALSIDELSKRYIEPAMSVLVSGIEGDVLVDNTKKIYQHTGTAGTVVGASADISAITNARAKLNQQLAPKSDRAVQFDSVTMGSIVNGCKALFHDGTQVKEAFREGFYSRNAMADWYENEKTWSLTNGSDVTANTDAAALVTDGGSTLDFHTLGAQQSAGQVFTIAGVYDVHPETKQAYSHLKQFTILTANNSGATTISPPTYLTGAKKNVASSTGADLATTDFNAKTLTFYGSASTTYRQNIMYHRDYATFVTADLPLMDDAIRCVRRSQDGLSLRVWQGSDIRNDELLLRIDILYGYKVLRPEWACRIGN
jgi:hypothetical protein